MLRLERTKITPDPAAAYRQIGVYSWGKGIIENEAIPGAELSKVTYYRFPPNALILSNIQAWEAAIAVSTERQAEEFIASQRFLPYVPIREGEVEARYLLHFFLSDPGMVLIRKASPGTVTRNRTLGMKAFEDLVVPLPDVTAQSVMVGRLDQLADIATLIERQRAVAVALPQAARNEIFSKLV
ncbi:restriction endonuclease subunit S [Blastococcus saxobsidens]|uniref:Restriction endonuclease subunit S n=1 Tax=Blastococcus saxobsidens TaxID=138336 RepID=A0A6L9W5K1_9ACTN|nr:restriction endonuclease subunit S [Blastococcus saxobsidens]